MPSPFLVSHLDTSLGRYVRDHLFLQENRNVKGSPGMELIAERGRDVDGGRDAGAAGEGRGRARKRGETGGQSQPVGPGAPWEGPGSLPIGGSVFWQRILAQTWKGL